MRHKNAVESAKALCVLIADGHDVVRRGLKEILLDAFPGTVSCETCDGDETLRKMAGRHFDLVLLDINMPGHRGLTVLRDARREYPEVPLIVVSVHPEDQYAKRCMSAGAVAYIRKDRAS